MKRLIALISAVWAVFILPGAFSAFAQGEGGFGLPSSVEGIGTHFEATNGADLNITLDSSEAIQVKLDALPGALNFVIESAEGAVSADIAIGGLAPNTTYYKYEDDYNNLVELASDEVGAVAYTQDLTGPHLVMLQSYHSTRSVPTDTAIGVWDPATRVYTLTRDVSETIQIDASSMTLDGAGHRVFLSPPRPNLSSGIYVAGKTGVTLRNVIVMDTYYGVRINGCSNVTLTNNVLANNILQIYAHSGSSYMTIEKNALVNLDPAIWYGYGCFFRWSCAYNTFANNTVADNYAGCFIESSSHHNTVRGNALSGSGYAGCLIKDRSYNNTVYENTFSDNITGCLITNNDSQSSWAGSDFNTVYGNNFLPNTTHARVAGGCDGNVFHLALPQGGNFWDSWIDPDNNSDGFVDLPYAFTGGMDPYPRVQAYDLNLPPVADPGEPQTAYRGQAVVLDGTGSFDPNAHHPLSYWWYLTGKPAGSTAGLTDAFSANPTVVPDLLGGYIIYLVVADSTGMLSIPRVLIISTENAAPVAYAGDDQVLQSTGVTIALGDQPNVPGYDPDGDAISYCWTMIEAPEGSAAILDNPAAAWPTFVADRYGTYVFELVVTDKLGAASEPDTVTISCENIAPVADAGANQAAMEGDTIQLDGSASHDANGDSLTYHWSLVSVPAGSAAVVSTPDQVAANFVADLPGTYAVSLVVNDGLLDSTPSNITIEAISYYDAAVAASFEVMNAFNVLPVEVFKNKNLQKPLTNKMNAVLAMIEQGNYQEALDKLAADVAGKADGCASGGAPDPNDHLTTCKAQASVYPSILKTMARLEELLQK